LFLIEDAAHAHGASIHGRKAGSLGKVSCFSFYPTKVITTGEGGMITTNDDELAQRAKSYRNHGANPTGDDYIRVSTNWRLPEVSAALGLVQLSRLEEFLERRNQIAAIYHQSLSAIPGIDLLPIYPSVRHSYWNYIALLGEKVDRLRLAQALWERFGVPVAWPYDPPCHLQLVFRDALGCRPGDLPQSERVLNRHIALPMHVGLSDGDVIYIIESLQFALEDIIV
jgi:dTDP-4-amino-4,6-dideoxygalactose transaminase